MNTHDDGISKDARDAEELQAPETDEEFIAKLADERPRRFLMYEVTEDPDAEPSLYGYGLAFSNSSVLIDRHRKPIGAFRTAECAIERLGYAVPVEIAWIDPDHPSAAT